MSVKILIHGKTMINFEEMTKKQKRAFKKMCSIHGCTYVQETLESGKQDQRDFVLRTAFAQNVWWRPNNLSVISSIAAAAGQRTSIVINEVFDIPHQSWNRTQGQMQKGSYRANRLNETFEDWRIKTLLSSNHVGKPLLFSLNLGNLNSLIEYGSRWYMPAASLDEAQAVFHTMVLMPLGHGEPAHPGHASADVKCHGLAEWFDYNQTNVISPKDSMHNYELKLSNILDSQKKLDNSKRNLDMTFAILNQLRAFTDVGAE